MPRTHTLSNGPVTAVEYVCDATPADAPYTELHAGWSISYVRRGSFGCQTRGQQHELVPGSVLIGQPGDEYLCTHDHHICGDECLAFFLAPEVVDELTGKVDAWQSGAMPALPELVVLGEMAQAAVMGRNALGFDEIGLALAARFVQVLGANRRASSPLAAADRRRAVESANWIDAHAADAIDLHSLAQRAGLSPFHFLRVFSAVLGVTPHQYLIRCRLREAARLLHHPEIPITEIAYTVGFGDLSNFVRSFGRAAGTSPGGYRQAAQGDRNFFQARIARAV